MLGCSLSYLSYLSAAMKSLCSLERKVEEEDKTDHTYWIATLVEKEFKKEMPRELFGLLFDRIYKEE